jgi:O-antigen polysaccharide polymerase Wzy-like protein
MSATAPIFPTLDYRPLRIPMAAFEALAYLVVVAAASLAFLVGWLNVNGAVVLTVALLTTLIVLSWVHLGQGRHPCFLFLCTLMFFQGGRLLAYCLGVAHPLQVQLVQAEPFSISRTNEGTVLLCLALSAICLYAPCRWKYQRFPATRTDRVRQYLPYLYLLFFAALPVQIFKNYRYFQWAQQHGGYNAIFLSHAALAASVPFLVRVIPLISFPSFVTIFVFEHRKSFAYLTAALYFAAALLVLLMGSRGAIFALILTLWYVARVKSTRRAHIILLALFAVSLMLVADAVRQKRENPQEQQSLFLPSEFLGLQGGSIDVTSTVVAYRDYFAPHAWMYRFYELQNAFVAIDTAHYQRGKGLPYDVPVLLNVNGYNRGAGAGGSYVAESYAIGGIAGVLVLSLLVGGGLHLLHVLSRSALGLFLVAMTLPDVLLMPRGELLDWLSTFLRNAISIVLLWFGWKVYSLLTSIRHSQRTHFPPHAPEASAP